MTQKEKEEEGGGEQREYNSNSPLPHPAVYQVKERVKRSRKNNNTM